ncbi:MAG TPA: hypothetical protein VFC45_08915 [Pseudolabrys sp.]|nr:hypothetical protein [Pseudolabrys sp.]
MLRSLGFALALILAPSFLLPQASAQADDRTVPMRFELRRPVPGETCGATCATWISASGAITADSARDFMHFMQGRNLRDATVVLDSDGGSVHGAIALGREIRKLAFATTVGRTVDIDGKNLKSGKGAIADAKYAVLSPRADCESMCAFVLLGGMQRMVPSQARVMVHQIWLGDRREDPTAANYSAEDLVLVQRDIGKLAQYTAEMGASIDLLDLALRIPPWEPLHVMTRDEIRRTRLSTGDTLAPPQPATVAASPPAVQASPTQPMTDGARAMPISERRWAMVEHSGVETLARRHPLTVEGELIGSFDLAMSCGSGRDSFDLRYVEHRRAGDHTTLPDKLKDVSLRVGRGVATLKLASSDLRDDSELVSYAAGSVPAALIRDFAGAGNHSMTIETTAKDTVTTIRIGNTGAQKNLPRLLESCGVKPLGDRADAAPARKTGGMAALAR